MKIAVCDTCTLVRLFKGNALHCLSNLFEKIYLPEAVKNECHDIGIREAISKPPFEVRKVETILQIGMQAGEREAISLAVETGTKYFLSDDERALKKAFAHHLIPVRSFQLLITGKKAGLIKSVGGALRAMEKAGEGIDADLYIEALKLAGEI